ncbi:hypothetical protein J7K92_01545 [bacterium]|nr:hypothetical protein [bacterium]
MTEILTFQKNISRKLAVIFSLIVSSLVFLYIFQFLNLNNKNFAISNTQKKISQINQTNKRIEIQISKQGFIEQAEKFAQELDFEKIKQIDYLKIGSESVAQK